MAQLTWNAEGGTDGVTVTTGNSGGSSGTAWDTVAIPASGTFVYDATVTPAGARSARLATAGTSGAVSGQWLAALQAIWPSGLTTMTFRRVLRVAALPSANRTIIQFTDVTGATNRMNVLLLTTGAIRLRNAASGTVVTSTTTVSLDTSYWIAGRADGATSGAYQIDIGLVGSSTPLESIVGGTANFGGAHGAAAFGYVSAASSLANQWLDSVLISDSATVPGPEATGHTVAVGTATETDTAQPLGRLKTWSVGTATETDTALALGRLKTRTADVATETDAALPLGRGKIASLGVAGEADAALTIARAKRLAIVSAAETDTAQPLGRLKTRLAGTATETDEALSVLTSTATLVGTATESDTALVIGRRKARTIAAAVELDQALPITRAGGPQRNLILRLGRPESGWRIGSPESKWIIGRPE